MEKPGLDARKDLIINKAELGEFINRVREDLETRSGLYAMRLKALCDEIRSEQPGIVFCLDRSARPIAWMLQSVKNEWQISKPNQRMPIVKSISIDRNKTPDRRAIGNPHALLEYNKSEPAFIVDEFSESKTGERNVDFAGMVLRDALGDIKIVKFVFMEKSRFIIPPYFYRGQSSQKDVLYYDQFSNDGTQLRNIPFGDFTMEQQIYKGLFVDFGKNFARQ